MENRYTKTKRLMTITMLLTMSILLQLLEPGLPLPVPGVKLGLANIMGLITLFLFTPKDMLSVNLLRVLLASLLRGTLFGTAFWLSLSGVCLSTVMVILLKKYTPMSIIGLSVASSVFHCLGQILAVSVIWDSIFMITYLPVMWLLSVPTGVLTGTISKQVLIRMKKEA